jgi:hypothetical protein
MTTEANYMGWTYDEAANRHDNLNDARDHLHKAIISMKDAKFPYSALCTYTELLSDELTSMSFVMARCKQIEEKATVRLGGEL